MLIHFLYRDEPDIARFQSGLVTLGGKAKPAYAAFELPLAQTARSRRKNPRVTTSLWGELRAPGAGSTAQIEQRTGNGWRTIGVSRPERGACSGSPARFREGAWCACMPDHSSVRP